MVTKRATQCCSEKNIDGDEENSRALAEEFRRMKSVQVDDEVDRTSGMI